MHPGTKKLEEIVREVLQAHPKGLSEHALIQALRAGKRVGFVQRRLREPLALFQTHFLLFHVLYSLRERCWAERSGHLDIHPMRIVLSAYRACAPGLSRRDPLRDYYLDLSRLEHTEAEDVYELLLGFRQRTQAKHGRGEALAVLGLSDPVDTALVKRTYRRLAMNAHPDRGGNTAALQRLNAAMAVLSREDG